MTPIPYVIVTGATGAIGRQICFDLYRQGYNLILACRNTYKAEALAKNLDDDYNELLAQQSHTCYSSQTHKSNKTDNKDKAHKSPVKKGERRYPVLFLKLDLSSSEETRLAAKEVEHMVKEGLKPAYGVRKITDMRIGARKGIEITALINNAGIMCREFGLTEEGIETTMAVNYHNSRVFTEAVMEMMPKGSQIIFTTSVTRLFHHGRDREPQITQKSFSQLGTYGLSKRMVTDYAASLAKEYPQTGIRVNCADPGIVNTGMITMHRWFDPIADKVFRPFIRTPRQGAEPAMRAFESNLNGKIFGRHRISNLI